MGYWMQPYLLVFFLNNLELRVKGKFKAVGSKDFQRSFHIECRTGIIKVDFYWWWFCLLPPKGLSPLRPEEGSKSEFWILCGASPRFDGPGTWSEIYLQKFFEYPKYSNYWRSYLSSLKPCDNGIGGPLGLNGCSLQWPKMVSRSYFGVKSSWNEFTVSMNQISIIIVNLKYSSKRLSRDSDKLLLITYPWLWILTDFRFLR